MDEQRKYAILFAATIFAARKLETQRIGQQAVGSPRSLQIETLDRVGLLSTPPQS
jgi:hypothetical protein